MTLNTRVYANQAKSTLASAIGPSDTTISVADTSRFPALSEGEFFLATIVTGNQFEIVAVYGVNQGQFVNCIRGQENTVPINFPTGSTIENRATAETFSSFPRFTDLLAPIDSIESLDTPENSNSESYISALQDDGGNPIVVISRGDNTWRFINYPTIIESNTAQSGVTNTFLPFVGAQGILGSLTPREYIIEFTSGSQIGQPRFISSISSSGIFWTKPLPGIPSVGDNYDIYQSQISTINQLQAAEVNGIVFAIVLGD